MAELVDNAIQASARRIDIIFGYDDGAKSSKLAVVDDGYGMEPKVGRAAGLGCGHSRGEPPRFR